MKKLIIASLLLFTTQGIFAQLDWSQLSDTYTRMFVLAERVADETDKVIADDNGVGLAIEGGVVTLERTVDVRSTTQQHYKYKLVKLDGNKIPLDKISTEKVINKYADVLNKINESLKIDRGAQVDEILNSLFQ